MAVKPMVANRTDAVVRTFGAVTQIDGAVRQTYGLVEQTYGRVGQAFGQMKMKGAGHANFRRNWDKYPVLWDK